ncbi:MAG: hypothetical protein ACXW3Q_14990 [Rhodoplanes sp.]|jgi:hypothetical protein
MEAKIDAILLAVDPKHGTTSIANIDASYSGRQTDTQYAERVAEASRGDATQARSPVPAP